VTVLYFHQIAKQFAIPLVTNELLTEISFGDWEGKTIAEVKAADPLSLCGNVTSLCNTRAAAD